MLVESLLGFGFIQLTAGLTKKARRVFVIFRAYERRRDGPSKSAGFFLRSGFGEGHPPLALELQILKQTPVLVLRETRLLEQTRCPLFDFLLGQIKVP